MHGLISSPSLSGEAAPRVLGIREITFAVGSRGSPRPEVPAPGPRKYGLGPACRAAGIRSRLPLRKLGKWEGYLALAPFSLGDGCRGDLTVYPSRLLVLLLRRRARHYRVTAYGLVASRVLVDRATGLRRFLAH